VQARAGGAKLAEVPAAVKALLKGQALPPKPPPVPWPKDANGQDLIAVPPEHPDYWPLLGKARPAGTAAPQEPPRQTDGAVVYHLDPQAAAAADRMAQCA